MRNNEKKLLSKSLRGGRRRKASCAANRFPLSAGHFGGFSFMGETTRLSDEEKLRRFNALSAMVEAWHYVETELITDQRIREQFHKDCRDEMFTKFTDCFWWAEGQHFDPPSEDESTKIWIHNLFMTAYNVGKKSTKNG